MGQRISIKPCVFLWFIISLFLTSNIGWGQSDLQTELEAKLMILDSLRQEMQRASDAGDLERYDQLKPLWEKIAQEVGELRAKIQSDKESLAQAIKLLKDGTDDLKAGRNAEAVIKLISSLKYDPTNHQTYHNLGYAFFGMSSSPTTYAQTLKSKATENPEIKRFFKTHNKEQALIEGTLQKGDCLDLARKAFNEAVKLNPQYTASWIALGRVATAQGDEDGAIGYYNQALEIDPKESKALSGLGAINLRKGNFNRAEAFYQSAIQADSSSEDIWIGYGRALKEQGKITLAIDAFLSATRVSPRSYQAFYFLSDAYNMAGKYSEALSAAERSLSFKARYAPAWYQKGLALAHLNRKKEAEAAFEEAKKDPEWRERADYEIKVLKGEVSR
ncbi:MAG: tetratricopeptide repeat protein [bacterium]